MSGWELATRLALWVLVGGSLAVFGWFLADVLRLLGRRRRSGRPDQ